MVEQPLLVSVVAGMASKVEHTAQLCQRLTCTSTASRRLPGTLTDHNMHKHSNELQWRAHFKVARNGYCVFGAREDVVKWPLQRAGAQLLLGCLKGPTIVVRPVFPSGVLFTAAAGRALKWCLCNMRTR